MDKQEIKKKILQKNEEIKNLHTELELLLKFSEETLRYNTIIHKKRKAIDDCFRDLNRLCKEYKKPAYKKPGFFCCMY
jgi:hypothetical protein